MRSRWLRPSIAGLASIITVLFLFSAGSSQQDGSSNTGGAVNAAVGTLRIGSKAVIQDDFHSSTVATLRNSAATEAEGVAGCSGRLDFAGGHQLRLH